MWPALQHWIFAVAFFTASIALPASHPTAITTAGAGSLVTDNGTMSYQFSPDSQYMVYEMPTTTYNEFNLYSKPLRGGAAVKLSNTTTSYPHLIKISPDSQKVVYVERWLDQFTSEALYTVPISGTTSPTQIADDDVYTIQISPDSRRIVYRTTTGSIYSVAIDGDSPVELATANGFPGGTDDSDNYILISPDSQYVIYPKAYSDGTSSELYSVPIEGGTPTKLSNLPATGWLIAQFQVSPDSQTVVFKAWKGPEATPARLYSVPLTGGMPVQLYDNATSSFRSYTISPDSRWLVYIGMAAYPAVNLYSVPLSGGSPRALNPGLLANNDFSMSPDGATIVYSAYTSSDSSRNLYRVPVEGGSPVQLTPTRPFSGGDMTFWISPDGRYIVYSADLTVQHQSELYTVPLMGGPTRKLNLPIPLNQQIFQFFICPDSRLVVYALYHYDPQEEPSVITALISARIDGSNYVSLKDTLATGNILDFSFTPDGTQVIYGADQDSNGQSETYSVSTYPLFLRGSLKPVHPVSYLPLSGSSTSQ
jgi:Tol biopolymer transport system component